MKSRKTQQKQTLTNQELKAIQGGMNNPPPSPLPGDQNTDARAQVIETGEA